MGAVHNNGAVEPGKVYGDPAAGTAQVLLYACDDPSGRAHLE